MRTKTKVMTAIIGVGVAAAATAGTAIASASDDNEQPITGEALDRASTAALEHMGGGTVTETEVGDEDSYYEVEVRLDDGRQVDVQLDEQFNVVSDAPDAVGDTD
ncbi:MAG: PepSY domain-containing protein [Acidimicrobiia bacterium]|nr:PepSY domain-containing protein [Acidimicrobiia bacterium]